MGPHGRPGSPTGVQFHPPEKRRELVMAIQLAIPQGCGIGAKRVGGKGAETARDRSSFMRTKFEVASSLEDWHVGCWSLYRHLDVSSVARTRQGRRAERVSTVPPASSRSLRHCQALAKGDHNVFLESTFASCSFNRHPSWESRSWVFKVASLAAYS